MGKSSSDESCKTSTPSSNEPQNKQTSRIRLKVDPVNTPTMSMFGFGRPQPSSAEKIAAAEQEMDLVTDMFNKLTKACMKKCIPGDYREGELNKGESVCIDRCTAKFFEVQMKVSEILQAEAQAKGAGGGGGMSGPFGGM